MVEVTDIILTLTQPLLYNFAHIPNLRQYLILNFESRSMQVAALHVSFQFIQFKPRINIWKTNSDMPICIISAFIFWAANAIAQVALSDRSVCASCSGQTAQDRPIACIFDPIGPSNPQMGGGELGR